MGKAVVEVQGERQRENKGQRDRVKVQSSKGDWGGKGREDREKK